MADNDIATRAPESDAQEKPADTNATAEQSVFPGDTPAQAGPSMGVCQLDMFLDSEDTCSLYQTYVKLT